MFVVTLAPGQDLGPTQIQLNLRMPNGDFIRLPQIGENTDYGFEQSRQIIYKADPSSTKKLAGGLTVSASDASEQPMHQNLSVPGTPSYAFQGRPISPLRQMGQHIGLLSPDNLQGGRFSPYTSIVPEDINSLDNEFKGFTRIRGVHYAGTMDMNMRGSWALTYVTENGGLAKVASWKVE